VGAEGVKLIECEVEVIRNDSFSKSGIEHMKEELGVERSEVAKVKQIQDELSIYMAYNHLTGVE